MIERSTIYYKILNFSKGILLVIKIRSILQSAAAKLFEFKEFRTQFSQQKNYDAGVYGSA